MRCTRKLKKKIHIYIKNDTHCAWGIKGVICGRELRPTRNAVALARYRSSGDRCCLPGRRRRSPGCQDVVPNANDVVDSHLTRDYPLNGGLRPGSGPVALTKPVIMKLEFTSELHSSCKCHVREPLYSARVTPSYRYEVVSDVFATSTFNYRNREQLKITKI